MAIGNDLDDLHEQLRGYIRRIESHPVSTWSSGLLGVINAAIDMEFGNPQAQPVPNGVRLRLI